MRLRVAAKVDTEKDAKVIGEEVEALYLNGPAGPSGVRKYTRPVVAIYSTTIPRETIDISLLVKEVL